MLKRRQENRKEISKEIEKELLLQGYSRYVSRAHTIFSTLFDILLGVLFGTLGVIISLVEIGVMPWNKYYFLNVVFFDVVLISFVVFLSTYKIYESRRMRSEIVKEIKNLYNVG